MQRWVRDAGNPVVVGIGSTIVHAADPAALVDGDTVRLWLSTVGSREEYASVGYAESGDNGGWSAPAIVLSPSDGDAWDNQKVEIPSVIRDEAAPAARRYQMWYGGASRGAPDLTKIGLAYSADGISWTRLSATESPFGQNGLVFQAGNTGPGDNAVASDPTVLKRDGVYHMWYNSWGAGEEICISHAVSPDGIHWSREPNGPVLRYAPGTWEAGGLEALAGNVAQCAVLWDPESSRFWMWYGSFSDGEGLSYEGIGFAVSRDGAVWRKLAQPVLVPSPSSPGEQRGLFPSPTVVCRCEELHMFYSGVTADGRIVTNHASARVEDVRRSAAAAETM